MFALILIPFLFSELKHIHERKNTLFFHVLKNRFLNLTEYLDFFIFLFLKKFTDEIKTSQISMESENYLKKASLIRIIKVNFWFTEKEHF